MVDGWMLLGGLLLATGLFVYIRVYINCVCLSVSDYESSATMLESGIFIYFQYYYITIILNFLCIVDAGYPEFSADSHIGHVQKSAVT